MLERGRRDVRGAHRGWSRTRKLLILTAVAALCAPAAAYAGQDEAGETEGGVVGAFKTGTVHLDLRYRYEYVDQDGIDKKSHASTLRTVLNYRTGSLRGFDFFIEAENVVELGDDWYRDAGQPPRGNGVTDRPVVADPAGTDINQVYLRYRGYDSDFRLGRQEINIDDQRFVGAVGWRQHHQTFAAVNLQNASINRLSLQYAFINNVYRILGDRQNTAHNLLHATVDAGTAGKLNAYGYLLNYTQEQFYGLSTNTFGIEFLGSQPLGDGGRVHYELDYARQTDAADNPAAITANYAHLMGGAGYQQWVTAKVGWELLGGSESDGQFRTPLATLHKFNGWADKFLNTPTNGLRDLYFAFNGAYDAFAWLIVYHDFRADTGGARYGSELDWQLTYRSDWQQLFAIKGAHYAADEFATDTTKIWIWTGYTF